MWLMDQAWRCLLIGIVVCWASMLTGWPLGEVGLAMVGAALALSILGTVWLAATAK